MKIISINANKKLFTDRSHSVFLDWLADHKCDLLTVQEPWTKRPSEGPELPGMHFIGGSDDVVFWCRIGLESGLSQTREHWLSLPIEDYQVHSVHLDPDSSKRRREQITEISEQARPEGRLPIVLGDFNLAPRPEDGIYGDQVSKWNTKVEREAFSNLLASNHLVDSTAADDTDIEFTFERMYRKKWARFRCDLALIPEFLDPEKTQVRYDHSARTGSCAFTDHSAIIVELPDDLTTSLPIEDPAIESANPPLPATPRSTVEEFQPYKTAIKRTNPSAIAKALTEHPRFGDFRRILDYGCGHGRDVEFYRSLGKDADGWDPHVHFGWLDSPEGWYDLVTVVYVVHVLPTEEQRLQVLRSAAMYGEHVLIVARSHSEIQSQAQKGNWAETSDGFISSPSKSTFQKGFTTDELKELARKASLEPMPFKLPGLSGATYCMATVGL
jgi:exonuclease III